MKRNRGGRPEAAPIVDLDNTRPVRDRVRLRGSGAKVFERLEALENTASRRPRKKTQTPPKEEPE